ncbi:nitrilase-related carbon-nitrogen hydrolase [Brevibacterium sp. FAM 25378]|uniref:nitrilase-related carbon-nitrogen hydrolase n=1 Tax=unclassified Brevibacterium TaxID=2614124 RepID=UPI001091897D|nr:nitrilase-related carbon-nitrogen hydrolase [Brevibacterium sp. S22]TGD30761.1 hydrolase [Brevibacterium sp. S22]
MKIALAQINTDGRVDANLDKVKRYVLEAADSDASMIVFPEATMTAFGTPLTQACADFGEYWTKTVSVLAQEAEISIVIGEFEKAGHRVRNLAAVYLPDGTRAAYAKIHTYDAFGYRESEAVEPGSSVLTINIGSVTFGLAICYDIRFPKLFAELSRSGAQVVVVPTSWGAGEGKVEQWQVLTRARALDSNTTIVAVDQADPGMSGVAAAHEAPTGVGHSTVVDPFGHVLLELGGEESLSFVDIDPDHSKRARQSIPILSNAKLGY